MSFTRDNQHDTTSRDDASCSNIDTTSLSMTMPRDDQSVSTDDQLTDNIIRHLDKCDIRMLKEFDRFLEIATREQMTSKLSVHTITGLETFSAHQKYNTDATTVIDIGKSLLQHRKTNMPQPQSTPQERSSVMQELYCVLGKQGYHQRIPNTTADIDLDMLEMSTILIVMDSNGFTIGRELYTTPNATIISIPDADFSMMATAIDWIMTTYAPHIQTVIFTASLSDYEQAYQHAKYTADRMALPLDFTDIEAAAHTFVQHLADYEFRPINASSYNKKLFWMAPILTQLPLSPDLERKAEGLLLFNRRVRTLVKQQIDGAVVYPFQTIFIDTPWFLSTDGTHIRPHQTPLLLLKVEDEARRYYADLPTIIDCPEAATTLYYMGHLAFLRIVNSNHTRTTKINMLEVLSTQEETLRHFPQTTTSTDLDQYQVPINNPRLTKHNSDILQAIKDMSTAQLNHDGLRPIFSFPSADTIPNGILARTFQMAAITLHRLVDEAYFWDIMTNTLGDVLEYGILSSFDIDLDEHAFTSSSAWMTWASQLTSQMTDSTDSFDTQFRQKGLFSITLLDYVILTMLFPDNFDEGPQAFWNDHPTPQQWITYHTFLERNTIRLISYNSVTTHMLHHKLAHMRGVILAWIAKIMMHKGGLCLMQLQYETGLHIFHLRRVLTNDTLTVILGWKNNDPVYTPPVYSDPESSIFYFVTYLKGIEFTFKNAQLSISTLHRDRIWDDHGRDTDCNAYTETLRAIGTLSHFYGSTEDALQTARDAMPACKTKPNADYRTAIRTHMSPDLTYLTPNPLGTEADELALPRSHTFMRYKCTSLDMREIRVRNHNRHSISISSTSVSGEEEIDSDNAVESIEMEIDESDYDFDPEGAMTEVMDNATFHNLIENALQEVNQALDMQQTMMDVDLIKKEYDEDDDNDQTAMRLVTPSYFE